MQSIPAFPFLGEVEWKHFENWVSDDDDDDAYVDLYHDSN